MDSIILFLSSVPLVISSFYRHPHLSCILPHNTKCLSRRRLLFSDRVSGSRSWAAVPSATAGLTSSLLPRDGIYTVADFMTRKEDLHVVKTTTTVEEDELTAWIKKPRQNLDDVGVISHYDLLALDSIRGAGQADTNLFSDVDSSWKTFNEIQTLISKTNGKVVGDLITPVPAVREATSLEDAVRLLLETRYRRLPVVDGDSKLELILIAETTEKWSD